MRLGLKGTRRLMLSFIMLGNVLAALGTCVSRSSCLERAYKLSRKDEHVWPRNNAGWQDAFNQYWWWVGRLG